MTLRRVAGMLLISTLPASLEAQQRIALHNFDGWETWPLVHPGDLVLETGKLKPLRIEFAGLFPGPNGFGRPPLDSLTMFMDVVEQNFRGASALWIQWLSKPPVGRLASPGLDALLIDRKSFRLLFRVAASAPQNWAGRYELIQAGPDHLTQATVEEDGTATVHQLSGTPNYFDFATYQFLFPFLKLEPGLKLRLSGYDYLDKSAEVLAVYVVGRVKVADVQGTEHNAWRVDVMPPHGATLVTFYIATEPPFFYGWDYRLTKDGATALKLTLRGWTTVTTR